MKFNVGDWVVPHPRHTLKFGNKLGKIRFISSDDALQFKVAFREGGQVYGFSYEELLSKEEFDREVTKPVACYHCGKDITGQFSLFCAECEYPVEGE